MHYHSPLWTGNCFRSLVVPCNCIPCTAEKWGRNSISAGFRSQVLLSVAACTFLPLEQIRNKCLKHYVLNRTHIRKNKFHEQNRKRSSKFKQTMKPSCDRILFGSFHMKSTCFSIIIDLNKSLQMYHLYKLGKSCLSVCLSV